MGPPMKSSESLGVVAWDPGLCGTMETRGTIIFNQEGDWGGLK